MDASARFEQRKTAIHLLRRGHAAQEVAQSLNRSRAWLYKWKARFEENHDFNDLKERSRVPKRNPSKLAETTCRAIRQARSELEAQAAAATGLTYISAQAVRARLQGQGLDPLPSRASIERVLKRAGMTRPRHPGTEPVTYPHLSPKAPHVLCQLDIVPHYLKGGATVACFNAIDVVSNYASGHSYERKRARDACDFLVHLWQEQGIARYTQTDNEACFCGGFTHQYVLGQVLRLCLYVGTELVFSPHYHPESNGRVERFHQDYNAHVWHRGVLEDLAAINRAGAAFFADYRRSDHARRIAGQTPHKLHHAQPIVSLPRGFRRPSGKVPLTQGQVHFMRRVSETETISVLNVAWSVPQVEVGCGVWATLAFRRPEQAWLRIYDRAPDAVGRRCLVEHRFPLKEPVHPVRSVFQRTQPSRLDQWAKRLYRLVFEPAAVW